MIVRAAQCVNTTLWKSNDWNLKIKLGLYELKAKLNQEISAKVQLELKCFVLIMDLFHESHLSSKLLLIMLVNLWNSYSEELKTSSANTSNA